MEELDCSVDELFVVDGSGIEVEGFAGEEMEDSEHDDEDTGDEGEQESHSDVSNHVAVDRCNVVVPRALFDVIGGEESPERVGIVVEIRISQVMEKYNVCDLRVIHHKSHETQRLEIEH